MNRAYVDPLYGKTYLPRKFKVAFAIPPVNDVDIYTNDLGFVAVILTGVRPVERAISTAGGVRFSEVDDRLMLTRLPGTFVAGEMLDWEAPTGGYLLQGCFAMGVRVGRGVLGYLGTP